MRDHLIRISTIAAAKTAMTEWAFKETVTPAERDDEGNETKAAVTKDVFRLPTWCDLLPVDAYTDMGTPPTIAEDGAVKDPGTPPTLAPGKWFIVSLDRDVQLPDAAKAAIRADGEREDGLKLPVGIVGLSTVWAGMTLLL